MSYGITFKDLLDYGVTKSEIRTVWHSTSVRKNPASGKFDSLILEAILEMDDPSVGEITAFVMKRSAIPHQTAAKSMEWWRSRVGIVKRQIVYAWCHDNKHRMTQMLELKTGQSGLKNLISESSGAKLELIKVLVSTINGTARDLAQNHNIKLVFGSSTNGDVFYHVV